MPSPANSEQPSAASFDEVSPWPSLHADLVQLIGWRVLAAGDLLDYVWFRAVSTHWRCSAISPHGRGVVDPRFHPRRWLLLPEGHGLHPDDGKKTLFNLSTGVSVGIRLPLSTDCRLLDSVDGLLLVQWGKQDSAMIRLIHPFTGDFAELPPLMSLVRSHMDKPDDGRKRQCVDFRCVTSVSVSAGGVVAVMIEISDISRVFFATTKDQQWSVLSWSIPRCSTSIAFQGRLYMLASRNRNIYGGEQEILQLDPPRYDYDAASSSLLPPKVICTCPVDKITSRFSIAECDSEIILFGRTSSTDCMLVYRVSDIVMGKFVPVTSIGGKTLLTTIDNRISSQEDNIFVYLRETMAFDSKAIPNMVGDTIIRRRRLKDNTPIQCKLGSAEWSLTSTLRCDDGQRECKCGLVYHIYDSCDCGDMHHRKAIQMEWEKMGLLMSPAKVQVEMVQKWTPPVENYIKVNVDATYDNVAGSGTTGVIIRNRAGNLIRAQALWYEWAVETRAMEVLALKDGLQLASDLRFSHVVIESEVVNMCNRNTFERADIGGVWRQIKQLEESFSSCLVSHVPRQANEAAHLCAKQANSSRRRCLWVNYIPAFLRECMHH